jgi:hypothetical protein
LRACYGCMERKVLKERFKFFEACKVLFSTLI